LPFRSALWVGRVFPAFSGIRSSFRKRGELTPLGNDLVEFSGGAGLPKQVSPVQTFQVEPGLTPGREFSRNGGPRIRRARFPGGPATFRRRIWPRNPTYQQNRPSQPGPSEVFGRSPRAGRPQIFSSASTGVSLFPEGPDLAAKFSPENHANRTAKKNLGWGTWLAGRLLGRPWSSG